MSTQDEHASQTGQRCCERGGGRGGGRGRGGVLEPAVLAAVAAGGTHGYDLIRQLESITGGALVADPGGVYRILRRLEEDGFAVSSWAESEAGPQRREYAITDDGRDALLWWAQHLSERARIFQTIADAATAASASNPGSSSESAGKEQS